MKGHLVLIPSGESLKTLQQIKNHVYSSGYRFSIKPKGSTPHISLAQFETKKPSSEIVSILKDKIVEEKFTINHKQWKLTKKLQKANHLQNNDYYWISILFENNENLISLYKGIDYLLNEIGINDNKSYIDNVKMVKKVTDSLGPDEIKDTDCIANHMNISNYTRPERVDECYEYINNRVPEDIVFGSIFIVLEGEGKVGEINLV